MNTLSFQGLCCVVILAYLVAGCESADTRSGQLSQVQDLVWPRPPEVARVSYVQAIEQAEDLGIKRGFWGHVVDFFIGKRQKRLVRPMAVVSNNDDIIFVADPGVKGIHLFDVKNKQYRLIRRIKDLPLPSPVAMAFGAKGELIIVDSALASIYTLGPGQTELQEFELDVRPQQPTGIVVDMHNRQMYITDTAAHQILVYTLEGKLVQGIGRRGIGNGEFNFPTMLWQDGEHRLWVADTLNFRVQAFSRHGEYEFKFGKQGDATGDLSRIKGVATDSQGHVYIVDGLFNAVQIFDTKGQFLLSIGQRGQKPGEFWLPTGIFIRHDDRIFVADSHNRRVQVFQYKGNR